MKFLLSLLTALGLSALPVSAQSPQDGSADTNIKIWPRQEVVCWPTNLEQFMFIETPKLPLDGPFTLTITLPENVTVNGFFTGRSPAVPPRDISMMPESWKQDGNVVTVNIPAGVFPKQAKAWLSTDIMVKAAPGDYTMNITVAADGKKVQSNDFKVKVYPELVNKTSEIMPLAMWYYTGLDAKYVPAFMKQFMAAGANAFYSMDGERVNGEIQPGTVAELAPQMGTEQGVVFFSGWVLDYAKKLPLPEEFKDLPLTLQSFIDHPELGKWALKEYLTFTMGGREHQVIIYDAEAGCVRKDHIEGDLTEYSLKKFSKEVGADHTLTPDEIFKDYQDQWMWYNCRQTTAIAKLAREVVDNDFAGAFLKVYSGYEYDFAPYKNLTRRNYSVDWKSLSAEAMPDYVGAGYYGNRQDVGNTYKVLAANGVTYVPAEMYVENFLTPNIGNLSPERFAMRLIQVFMNSGMRGMSFWYAADMDGGALIAMSEFTKFVLAVEDFAIRGQIDTKAVSVFPKTEEENVYVLRDTKQALVVMLNNTDKPKKIRLTLNDFKIKGYTSDLQITNLTTNEKIPAARVITVEVAPFSYTLLDILDDGN